VSAKDVRTESVTVTATRSEVSLQDAPGAITIITQEDIKDMPAGDLLEIIRETAGISMIGRGLGRRNISLRGMESRHTLILVDGKRIAVPGSNFGHANYKNNWVDPENIERIEIIRGPLSALYGSDALGGVINIITKPVSGKKWSFGIKTGGGIINDDGGDNTHLSANARGPLVNERLVISLSAGYDKDDDTPSEDNPDISELEGIETFSFNSKVAFTPNKKHTVDLGVDFANIERWYDSVMRGKFYDSEYDVDKYTLSLSWRGSIGPTHSNIKVYSSVIDKDYVRTSSETGKIARTIPEKYSNDVLDAQTTFSLGSNLFTLGGELRKETLESSELVSSGEDDAIHSSLFIQDEIELFEKLRITLGGRIDDHEVFGSEFSPRIYGLYQVTDQINLKVGYGHAFNAPTLKQMSDEWVLDHGSVVFHGNSDIGPETSDNYEIGAEYNTSAFWAKAFFFHNDIEDMIQWTRFGQPVIPPGGGRAQFQMRAENINEVKIKGVETEMGVVLDSGIELSANYSYLDAKDEGNDKRLAGKPKHTLNAKLGYTLEQFGLSTALRFQFIGNQVMKEGRSGLADVPDYSLWHFSVRKQLGEIFELQIGVENIGDVRLADESELFSHEERGRFFYANLMATF
jgi:outer membrane receptor for ferrienterochelin and colicins